MQNAVKKIHDKKTSHVIFRCRHISIQPTAKKEEDKIWSVLNKTMMILNKRKDNQLVRNKEVQT